MTRLLLLLCALALPPKIKRFYYRRIFGWTIGKGTRIGLSYIDSITVEMDSDIKIGHFNVFRNLRSLRVGRGAYVGNFNEFFGGGHSMAFPSELSVGEETMIMSHHFMDVAGTVEIGSRATVGGRDTHIWSHTLRVNTEGKLEMIPIRSAIGDGAYLGARVTVIGCSVPPGAIVGAGSVLTKSFAPQEQRMLIAGNPATIRKLYA